MYIDNIMVVGRYRGSSAMMVNNRSVPRGGIENPEKEKCLHEKNMPTIGQPQGDSLPQNTERRVE